MTSEQPESAEAPVDPGLPEQPAPVQVRLRRAPRYRVFVVTGAVLGAVVGAVLALALADGGTIFSRGTVAGYLAAIGLLVGGLLGAAVALLADRPRR